MGLWVKLIESQPSGFGKADHRTAMRRKAKHDSRKFLALELEILRRGGVDTRLRVGDRS